MLRLACIAVLIGAALLSGCMVASTYPLYATGDPTKVPGLAGNWTTSDGKTWLGFFDPMSEDEDFMTLAMRGEDGHTSYFKVHPVIIRETQLLDIEPAPEPGQSELLATLASYHWIVQAEFTATDEWTLRVLDPQKTWDYLKTHPRVADFNARVDDEGALQELTLTGPTEQVRSLFARSLPDLFGEPLVIVPEAK